MLETQDQFPYVARDQWVTEDRVTFTVINFFFTGLKPNFFFTGLKPNTEQTVRGKNIAILYFHVGGSTELTNWTYYALFLP